MCPTPRARERAGVMNSRTSSDPPPDRAPGGLVRRGRTALGCAVAAAVVVLVPTPAQAAPPSQPTVAWGACADGPGAVGMECATLDVPVDPAQPDGRRITLALGRLPATGPQPAEGSVLINFGGPGAPGIALLRDRGAEAFAQLRQRMDIVTWDPRGYGGVFGGRSTELPCDWRRMVRPTPPFPADQAGLDQIAAANRAVAVPCRDTDPELFDHMDSASNAHDMERIRQALGEPQLDFYGSSYGGYFGQAYARLYPDRIRTMVLDGTANHATGDWAAELDAIAHDNESAFGRFVEWCGTDPSCVLHGTDVAGRWQQLVADADRSPIPATGVDARYTGRDLQGLAAGDVMAGPAGWAALAQAIATAENGDAAGFVPPGGGNPYPIIGSPGVTECLEIPRYADQQQMATTVDRLRAIAPNRGAAFPLAAHVLSCAGWPAPLSNPPAPLPDGVPPLLGAGTWLDFGGTDRVVQQVPGSVSIFHDGPGHVLYASGNACVVEHVNRYFTTAELPSPGTRC